MRYSDTIEQVITPELILLLKRFNHRKYVIGNQRKKYRFTLSQSTDGEYKLLIYDDKNRLNRIIQHKDLPKVE